MSDEFVGKSVISWGNISGADLLQGWAAELKAACVATDEREWRDVGRAVILIVDDFSRAERVARQVAETAGMNFLNVDDADVVDLAPRTAFRKQAPALLYLEPGEWLRAKQEDDDDEWAEKKRVFHKKLAKWIEEFDSAKPIVLVTGNYKLGDMSTEIDKPGCFDRYFVLPEVSFEQQGDEFLDALGRDIAGETLLATPEKLGKLVARNFSRAWRRDNSLLYLRRLYRKDKRLIEFTDLMHVALHGFGEEALVKPDEESVRRQVAVHEAGHAVMAIVDSQGEDMPEYCSIMPGASFRGIMAPSINYYQSLEVRTTYAGFRHDIRVSLAGRAAEEIIYGPLNVSSGAAGDLESSFRSSHKAFARWGFAPDMDNETASASNLAVVVDDPTPSESAHVENLIRTFLAKEYAGVVETLLAHRDFLDAVADRLMIDPIVDQNELAELVQQHAIIKAE